jgi:hypothetical protein
MAFLSSAARLTNPCIDHRFDAVAHSDLQTNSGYLAAQVKPESHMWRDLLIIYLLLQVPLGIVVGHHLKCQSGQP